MQSPYHLPIPHLPQTQFMYIVLLMGKMEQIEACLRTDPGLVRGHNEDFIYAWEPKNQDAAQQNGWLYIVADGVGGADAGEVASQYSSERMSTHYLESEEKEWGHRIYESMQWANTDLRRMVAEREDNSRMATTMVIAVIHGSQATIGNVGDSRAYHWRQGKLRQVTKDQSLVAKLVEEGAITEEEAAVHPRRNVILYSLGSERKPQIDIYELDLQTADILLLCSDGLTRHVSDDEMSEMIANYPPTEAADRLIRLANNRGGEDNISVAIIHYNTVIESDNTTKPLVAHTQPLDIAPNTAVSAATLTPPNNTQRQLLWLYTLALATIMSLLIFILWIILRI